MLCLFSAMPFSIFLLSLLRKGIVFIKKKAITKPRKESRHAWYKGVCQDHFVFRENKWLLASTCARCSLFSKKKRVYNKRPTLPLTPGCKKK